MARAETISLRGVVLPFGKNGCNSAILVPIGRCLTTALRGLANTTLPCRGLLKPPFELVILNKIGPIQHRPLISRLRLLASDRSQRTKSPSCEAPEAAS